MSFTVEFRNKLSVAVRVKTMRVAPVHNSTLNNGSGFDLKADGQSGSVQSATFGGDGNRFIVFWDVSTEDVLATRQEFFTESTNAFVQVQDNPSQPGQALIAIGALP